MDKQEYLKNRFKRDFLQYSLLQEDSLPAKNIAEQLYSVIDLNVLIPSPNNPPGLTEKRD